MTLYEGESGSYFLKSKSPIVHPVPFHRPGSLEAPMEQLQSVRPLRAINYFGDCSNLYGHCMVVYQVS
ncbi:uncharacterized protein ANIA_11535 [Aspergillus nidulans FGSC A4]|uniref:Uncharacterized protein n=1 Tax=Emericella nidulans (strain FGSC A4 / ATCC 38163 / CBS 112.46 / NRRL 194 / M139) TaxID=227321 RepID=C8V396_EMENI|nr:hypothetical protein [Aspergillus nidulans FGSC A4]CBF71830.1 TPA: hypothetical protein ANIA_11535 [Aspergillus nidulans FGSC A4]